MLGAVNQKKEDSIMCETLKTIGICNALVALATALAAMIGSSISTYAAPSYEARVQVDNVELLPYALSNAVEQVKSKGFQVVELTTSKKMFKNEYLVICRGIEKEKLMEW